ncbi:MAG: N-acetylmuramic acid 6-phosphate etherase [Thermoanaerobaculia bacterium]|nr:N-acetylmuramic acid 6-phosphate etherase [Thermoanaerobaculia bacterium]
MSESNPPLWTELSTESRNPRSRDLDRLPTEGIVELLLTEDRCGLEAALRQKAAIAQAADWAAQTLEAGGDVILLGAGTSGRLAVLEAAEIPPTFGTAPQRVRALIAGGHDAVFAAREGAEDQAEDGDRVAADLRPRDLLIGISASSVTPFVLGALTRAQRIGTRTVLLSCTAPRPEREAEPVADLVIGLDTGAEILTGSTRLKAGSATKAALNAITTGAMVRQGKTYQNLMVDLRPGSAKLIDRARRIVEAAAEVDEAEAERLLDSAGGEVKTAIVMAKRSCSAEQARRSLQRGSGHVRIALDDG